MSKQTILITGAAGFIGYNLVKHLVRHTQYRLHLVESQNCKPQQMQRLRELRLNDRVTLQFVQPHDTSWPRFCIEEKKYIFDTMAGVVHLGAECHTREAETPRLWRTNIDLSLEIIKAFRDYCPVLFASTAAIYSGTGYSNTPLHENMAIDVRKLSPYAWTKYAVEKGALQMALKNNSRFGVVGLRFFNVYGEHDEHKGDMISFPSAIWNQLKETGEATVCDTSHLFPGVDNARDFVHVEDCVQVIMKLLDIKTGLISHMMGLDGINYCTLNVGTGVATNLHAAASQVAAAYTQHTGHPSRIEVKPMPEHWRGTYQPYTCADMGLLQRTKVKFRSFEEGIKGFRWDGSFAI